MQTAEAAHFTIGSWDVAVDGVDHVVEIALDLETEKVFVRVDGRLAAKPIVPGETSREFSVGSERWSAVRGANDSFQLERVATAVVAPAPSYPLAAVMPPDKKASAIFGKVLFRLISALIVLTIVGFVKPITRDLLSPWYSYSAPDGSFKFSMPVKPFEQRRESGFSDTYVQTYDEATTDEKYEFFVMYLQLPRNIDIGKENEAINGFRDGIAKELDAHVVRDDDSVLGSEIVMEAPGGKKFKEPHDIKFRIVRQGPRIYFVGAAMPKGELGSLRAMRFFLSFHASTIAYAEGPR